jgi:hypothetical protein
MWACKASTEDEKNDYRNEDCVYLCKGNPEYVAYCEDGYEYQEGPRIAYDYYDGEDVCYIHCLRPSDAGGAIGGVIGGLIFVIIIVLAVKGKKTGGATIVTAGADPAA